MLCVARVPSRKRVDQYVPVDREDYPVMCADRLIPWSESLDSAALFEPPVVHQATGMMAVRLRVSCTDALAYLRGYAETTGVSLTAVAEGIVDRSLFPGM